MKARHSDSLLLVWRVSDYEARQVKSDQIEPTHLMLGLCKVVDLDLPSFVSKDTPEHDEILEEVLREVRRLRAVLKASNLDARTFRRTLRSKCQPPRGVGLVPEQLRRSKEAKEVFRDAEHFAEMTNSPVYPVHLLYAVLLAKDRQRDRVLSDLGVDLKRLREAAKREVLLRGGVDTAMDVESIARRN